MKSEKEDSEKSCAGYLREPHNAPPVLYDWKGYIACSVDGEGSLTIYKPNDRESLKIAFVVLSNTNKKMVAFVQKTLHGVAVIYSRSNAHAKDGCTRKPLYQLYVNRLLDAERLLNLILPYLVAKKQQAELMLEFIMIRRGWKRGKYLKRGSDGRITGYIQQHPSTRELDIMAEIQRLNE
jgi:hypothetical protein